MAQPQYLTPTTLTEAFSLLSKCGEKAKVLSGGTDLLVQVKRKVSLPECLIDVSGITELDYVKHTKKTGLRIGALAKVGKIAKSPLVLAKFNVLAQGTGSLGTPTIRNQATIGGNLCNAAPSADIVPALIVLGAHLKLAGKGKEKVLPVEDFFTGPGATVLTPHQMLVEIQIPNPPLHSGGAYLKQTRGKGADLAVAGIAAFVVLDGEKLKDVKIALGAVAPTPIRAKQAEAVLRGKKISDKLLEEAGLAASRECKPIDDIRGSAEYRRKLVGVLTRRAVLQAVQQAQSEALS